MRHEEALRAGVGFALGVVLLAILSGCGAEPPADWQWWTSADTAAVRDELARWRPFLDANQALVLPTELNLVTGLSASDSQSVTGDTRYKFAHLISIQPVPAESGHADEFQFGVAVDTIEMKDTFCQVGYRDTLARTTIKFRFDSLWAVSFHPETLPDSTVVWRVTAAEKLGFDVPRETTKTFDWQTRRVVFLPKDSGVAAYKVQKVTGFAAFVPGSADAPGIANVVLARPGRVDTLFYAPRSDGRGLYNLHGLDKLVEISPGEVVEVAVNTSTPADTTVDRNRFLLSAGDSKTDITAGARQGAGSFSLADTGLQNVYVEVIPQSSLLYKDAAHVSTVWAIPLRVRTQ
jgi:hypothetical protein